MGYEGRNSELGQDAGKSGVTLEEVNSDCRKRKTSDTLKRISEQTLAKFPGRMWDTGGTGLV